MQARILKIALPVPLRKSFDYLLEAPPPDFPLQPGLRVRIPFGKTKIHTGLLLGVARHSELAIDKLKNIAGFIDAEPLYDAAHMRLLEWAYNYYQHPVGEVMLGTLPAPLRRGKPLKSGTASGHRAGQSNFTKKSITLNNDQRQAAAAVCENLDMAKCFLLHGVTGSGKTEVYIEIIREVIAAGRQALILAPEIGLTPQLVQRLQNSFNVPLAVFHSSLSDGERLQSWLAARDGAAAIVLGTRSAIWTPLKAPGVIIVDEEHDLSYKQQEGFRYSARDVAVMRASMLGIPIVLGSATPSMESMQNVNRNKFIPLRLGYRTGSAQHPLINVIDMRAMQMVGALSAQLVDAIAGELKNRQQVLLFLNQRGFSPVIMCHTCGWMAKCTRCDQRMTYHKQRNKYLCHHCGSEARLEPVCPDCSGKELLQIGHGTERLAETLGELFPNARILRIDRDTTRRKGTMDRMIERINTGDADILIGTQMLAKGHHFPELTLVGIIDSDRGLFSSDFRASERMAQLFIQVSGRAGREDKAGKVLIQTHYPQHPLITSMISCNYDEFSRIILSERRAANLPPFSYLAMLRAEDYRSETVEGFLNEAKDLLTVAAPDLEVLGPMPAILEKRAGRLRYQLVVQTNNRGHLQQALAPWSRSLESLGSAGKVRWSLDVDPQEIF